MVYQATTATRKLLKLTKRIRGVAGGTSASKTISILLWLIDKAQTNKDLKISVVSQTMPHLKRGAMRDFLSIVKDHNIYHEKYWNKTDFIFSFSSGSIIEFFSADQSDKVRGPRRDILFINEANNVPFESYEQLEIRTDNIVWLDWNPVSEFWFYEFVKDRDNVDFITLTYKDNEALSKNIIDTIESRRDRKNWWAVYGLGQLGEAEGKIYTNWSQISTIPDEARLERYGLDFGYSNDPTAIIGIYRYNNSFILDEMLYRPGMKNSDLANFLLSQPKALVIADSAEPKSIDEIAEYGIRILPSQKGPGSVTQGIQFVQDKNIQVTSRSANLWKEYMNYLWMTDKDGKIINEPQDFLNHAMDALRYGLEGYKESDILKVSQVVASNRQKVKAWAI